MQKPTVGASRDGDQASRDKAPATAPLQRLTSRATRAVTLRMRKRSTALGGALGATLRPFTSAERALPIAVASIVAVAALLAFLPVTPQGAVNGIQSSTSAPRIAVNGGNEALDPDTQALAGGPDGQPESMFTAQDPSFQPVAVPGAEISQTAGTTDVVPNAAAILPGAAPDASATPESPVQDDGTLLTGYAPETTVEDGANLIRTYACQKGDTLTSVAKKFGVSMMTLWWANKLKKKDLKAGQVLRIPPVSGLVYTVKDTDTLDTVAAANKVDAAKIVELNGLEDPTLVVGQVLVLPGAKGAPMPTPKPTQRSTNKVTYAGGGSSGVLSGGPSTYPGGAFKWPVVGGGNYVSQYFHYGHYAIDIAADYGSKVIAAAPGEVIFAGWKNNGGGYQVWIAHGSGLYTTYNHMSSVSVSRGQSVARGDQVGRIGATGLATGPHLHFEVWKGPVWNGGTRVNPMGYF